MNKIHKHWFFICASIIILLSVSLRFYNYQDRWGLAYDQAHDALVARGAMQLHKIPLVGPFSSAGPFQSSGIWYWVIIVGTFFAPYIVYTPWVFVTILFVGYVLLIMYVGYRLVDKQFGLILGLLACVSPSQISQAVNLTINSTMALLSLFAIFAMMLYVKKKDSVSIFFLGFFVALAPTMHTQGYPLFLLLVFTFIFTGIPHIRLWLPLFFGIALPFVPMLIFDLQNNFVNSKAMVQYILHDQYKVNTDIFGRRWLTYVTVFWPRAFAYVTGGHQVVGYFITISLALFLGYKIFQRSLSKEWCIIIFTFTAIVALIRYVRTPIFDSYLIMLHTFIFLITGLLLYAIFKKYVLVGILCLFVVVGFSLQKSMDEISHATNNTAKEAKQTLTSLVAKFPNQKFAVYDYQYKTANSSLPLSLFITANGKSYDKGKKIGILHYKLGHIHEGSYLFITESGDYVVELEKKNKDWIFVNPSAIYRDTEEWTRK